MRGQSRCESWREDFFNARECKEPSVSPFKRVLAGASPATGAIHINGRVAQLEEARRRERRECWFKSSRDYHLEPEALIAKPPPFKRLRWVQVPTGSPHFRQRGMGYFGICRFDSCRLHLTGAKPTPVFSGETLFNFAAVRSEFLRSSVGRVPS